MSNLETNQLTEKLIEVKRYGEVIGHIQIFEGDYDWLKLDRSDNEPRRVTYKSMEDCLAAIENAS